MIKIDQVIKDMEDYLVNCKPVKFSGNKYAVEMDVLEDYINSLKHNLPAEVKNYKKLLMNQDQILRSAQAEAKSIVDKALQSENIFSIYLREDVSKFLKSKLVKEEQPENIPFILATLFVFKVDKSKEAKEEQPENIPFILVTIFVTKVDKSIDCKE